MVQIGYSQLHLASKEGKTVSMKKLLAEGADVLLETSVSPLVLSLQQRLLCELCLELVLFFCGQLADDQRPPHRSVELSIPADAFGSIADAMAIVVNKHVCYNKRLFNSNWSCGLGI